MIPSCLGQATLGLALDIFCLKTIDRVVLQQGVGRLINAVVAVLGPKLAPGSIFYSRCKECPIIFTQQLVLFAPQAVICSLPCANSHFIKTANFKASCCFHLKVKKRKRETRTTRKEDGRAVSPGRESRSETGRVTQRECTTTRGTRTTRMSRESTDKSWFTNCLSLIDTAVVGQKLVYETVAMQ